MKRLLFLISAVFLGAGNLLAQDIVAAEYFFDSDPGVGSGTAISVTSGAEIDITTSISTNGLSQGFHSLFIRLLDEDGIWSLYEGRRFYIRSAAETNEAAEIVAAEYFFNADPGIGSGTSLTITSGNEIDLSSAVPTSSLSNGFHSLFIRFLDADGKWSLYEGRRFYIRKAQEINVSTPITAMEYFFGTDPGIGNGTSVTITPGDELNFDLNIDVSGMTLGDYPLSIRVKDENDNWSIAETQTISIADCSQPIPDFEVAAACTDSTVLITDLSTQIDAGATYEWDINRDGSIDYTTKGNVEHVFPNPGNYSIELKVANEGGCSYKVVKNIEVFQTPDAPVIAVEPDTDICEGESSSLTAEEGYASYSWSSGESERSISVNSTGNYKVIVSDANNCKAASAPVSITAHELPVISFNETEELCKYESLDAGSHASYLWSDGSTEQTLEITEDGTYHVTVTDDFGCENYKETVVTIKDAPYVNLGPDTTICEGESLQLNAGSGDFDYLWNDFSIGQTLTVISGGTYSVEVTGENGCTSTDEIVVQVDALPEFASIDKVLPSTCTSTDASFTLNSTQNLEYSFDGGTTYTSENTLSGLSAGNYLILIRGENICPSDEVVNLMPEGVSLNIPDAEDIELCYGESGTFTAGWENIEWYNSNLETIANGSSYSPTENEVGNSVYYAATVEGNCKSEVAELNYTIYELPGARFLFGNEIEKCQYDTLIVNLQTIATNVEWIPMDGINPGNPTAPEIYIQSDISYQATATSDKGCISTTTLTISVLPAPGKLEVIGKSTACLNEQITYVVNHDNTGTINWQVNGGVLSQLGKDTINVYWNELLPDGSLLVHSIHAQNTCKSLGNLVSLSSSGVAVDKMDVRLKGDYLLYVPTDGEYQWYYDNEALPGKNEKWLEADVSKAENYNCLVTVDEVCETLSNPYLFDQGVKNLKMVELYPNPAKEYFILKILPSINAQNNGVLKILDLTGKLLFEKRITGDSLETEITISDLESGVYLWQYRRGAQQHSGKFVKSK